MRIDARPVDRIPRWLDALNTALRREEMDQLGFGFRSWLIAYNPTPRPYARKVTTMVSHRCA